MLSAIQVAGFLNQTNQKSSLKFNMLIQIQNLKVKS